MLVKVGWKKDMVEKNVPFLGVSPFTKDPCFFKAKPASKTVRVLANGSCHEVHEVCDEEQRDDTIGSLLLSCGDHGLEAEAGEGRCGRHHGRGG